MRRLVIDQISPGHSVSESRAGPLSVTNDGRRKKDEGRKFLCLIQDTSGYFILLRKVNR